MLRGFRHTLFLLLQVGVVLSGLVALAVRPDAWPAIAICVTGSVLASLICERIASRYLRSTLGQLRRTADDIGRGRFNTTIAAQPGDDFYKLVKSINHVATRLAELSAEEKRLHEILRDRERLAFLGELAATVAHEVNNPLDGVQNCARILRRSLDDPQRTRQMLDLIDGGLVRIELIVRRLMTLAREHVIRTVDARLRDVIDSAIEAVATKVEVRAIDVVRRFETADDWASVDPQLLEQVFVNLLLNAADSMPTGGKLTMGIRRERSPVQWRKAGAEAGDCLCVEIADTGSGIPADVRPHIFEPFYTTKKGGKGTGLGLPIAARIVDAHQGSISVSPHEPQGTVFTIRLPARSLRPVGVRSTNRDESRQAALPTGS